MTAPCLLNKRLLNDGRTDGMQGFPSLDRPGVVVLLSQTIVDVPRDLVSARTASSNASPSARFLAATKTCSSLAHTQP